MKKRIAWLVLSLILIPAIAASAAGMYELSDYMYGSLSQTAAAIGGLRWDGDWVYANDIVQAYIGGGVTLAGNSNDQIKFIMLDAPCDHSLYGLRVGMDKSVLDEYCRDYLYHTYYDDGENYFFTLSMQPDGYTETLWVVEKGGRLTHVIYEVGYGHD